MWTGPNGAAWDRPGLDQDQYGVDALYRLYRTAEDGWICLAAVTDDHGRRLATALGLAPSLTDEGGTRASTRRLELEKELQTVFLTRPASHWTRLFDEAGVPHQVPVDTDDGRLLLRDEVNVSLGLVADYEHGLLGRLRQFGQLVQLSDTPGHIAGPPPLVGEHTRPVLRAAGYRDPDIDALISQGAAYEPDDTYAERFVT
jgi:crotonobetainyl-CoA:carnitine CoA-transferase CaiB-like acyl-CoA transferase